MTSVTAYLTTTHHYRNVANSVLHRDETVIAWTVKLRNKQRKESNLMFELSSSVLQISSACPYPMIGQVVKPSAVSLAEGLCSTTGDDTDSR